MRTIRHELGTIKVPGQHDKLDGLFKLAQTRKTWALDTETTGINAYAPDFKVRLVQMGTQDEAWVLRPEWHEDAIRKLAYRPSWLHNRIFDAIALEVHFGLDFDKMMANYQDTDPLARLIDPRPIMKGGTGHKLEQLAPYYIGTESKQDSSSALLAAAKKIDKKILKKDMWWKVPSDMFEYNMYAGQDILLTTRLADKLVPIMQARPEIAKFYAFELPLQARIAMMQRIGIAFDPVWANKAEAHFDKLFKEAEKLLRMVWKVDQTATYAHTSKKSLQTRFEDLGVKWTKRSEKTDEPSLDAEVLHDLVRQSGDVGKLATAVLTAKQNKHYGDYIRSMRAELGFDGRIHPNVKPMQAATARMSVSNPAVQQFPRDDIYVRGCMAADEGTEFLGSDFAQVEFRIGAAVSRDPVMKRKIINGEDLHGVTAIALFGQGFNPKQRQASKPVGFGRLYLGSPKGIRQMMLESDTTGYVPSLVMVKKATKAFDGEYRVYYRWAMRLKDEVSQSGGLMYTATGRPLIVSPAYAAPNYMIQSTARDVFAAGINKIHKAGIGHMLRLVVHDEVILSVPKKEKVEVQRIVEECMSTTFKGVPIEVESEYKGERWRK